ncbi:hypothetical protein [Virgibacillus dokdonensis]|uniref:hypothetical protein n=1 Tax=Virgibacillus dokdonensis TaxID=302167 RepID=UPI00098A9DE2|nr:hypothetical protein [Virgibacillus dokdonensis]
MDEYMQEVYYKPFGEINVTYRGLLFFEGKFQEYIATRVKHKFADTDWVKGLAEEAEKGLMDTGFTAENLIDIFTSREVENSWRIGEYLAESVLEDRRGAKFYYNHSRDAKNPMGNDTGADLVGICDVDGETVFLFGEVKTSSDKRRPPNVVYGKTGMIYQLETLRDKEEKRNDLVKWIWGKATMIKGEFKQRCIAALHNYHQSKREKVKLVGVLVRDTEVSEKDLQTRAKTINKNIPNEMDIELIGIYSGYKMDNNNWINALNRSD